MMKPAYCRAKVTNMIQLQKIMKINKINRLVWGFVALTALIIGSCDENMGGSATQSFPTDTLYKTVVPGEVVDIPFTVSANWTLTSNAPWCKVDGKDLEIRGGGGKYTIRFVISDELSHIKEDQAVITLTIAKESRAIAYITRIIPDEEWTLAAYDVATEEEITDSIVMGTSGVVQLRIESNISLDNLRFSCPSWIGDPQRMPESNIYTLNIKEDSVKYPIDNPYDSLVITTKSGDFSKSFAISYEGMDSLAIVLKGQIDEELTVTHDAERCYEEMNNSNSYNTPIRFRIAAREDNYKIVALSYDLSNGGYMILDSQDWWFSVEDNKLGEISLSFEENDWEFERDTRLMALPSAVIEDLDNTDLIEFLLDEENQTKYQLIYFKQLSKTSISIDPGAQWNLSVSADGRTYTKGSSTQIEYAPLIATIKTYKGYELIHVSYNSEDGYVITKAEDAWYKISDNNRGTIRISFNPNSGAARVACLFALPIVLADSLRGQSEQEYREHVMEHLFEEIDGTLEIKEDSEQYLIAEMTQEPNKENSLEIIDGPEAKSLTVEHETDETWLQITDSRGLSQKNVFKIEMKYGYTYILNPLFDLNVWDPSGFYTDGAVGRVTLCNKNGDPYIIDEDYEAEPTENEAETNMIIQLSSYIEEPYIIYFEDSNGKALKAIVVTPTELPEFND